MNVSNSGYSVKMDINHLKNSEDNKQISNSEEQLDTQSTDENELLQQSKSLVYGVLGLDHPDQVSEQNDDAYTTGQVLKAIGTVGSIIAIVV